MIIRVKSLQLFIAIAIIFNSRYTDDIIHVLYIRTLFESTDWHMPKYQLIFDVWPWSLMYYHRKTNVVKNRSKNSGQFKCKIKYILKSYAMVQTVVCKKVYTTFHRVLM